MDNFLLQAIINELAPAVDGYRPAKVFQLGATDLMIDFRLRDGRWLYISTDPQRLALFLTSRSPREVNDQSRSDTSFASLFKKYLSGARLTGIEKVGYDRVVDFKFTIEEDSLQKRRNLIVMLTGRAANLLIIEQSKVIASLRERDDPIITYCDPSPPADKIDPFLCSEEKLDELIRLSDGDVAEAANKHLIGFSQVYANEMSLLARRTSPIHALRTILTAIFDSKPEAAIYSSAPIEELKREAGRNELMTLSPIKFEHLSGQIRTDFPTINAAADAYYKLLDHRREFQGFRQKLNSHISSRIKKQRALISNLRRDREKLGNAPTYQRYGDLLLANLHQAVKTETGFTLIDFFDERLPVIEIPSANKSTPQAAAEHYFRLARKARNGLAAIDSRLPEIERELETLAEHLAQIEHLTRIEELDAFTARYALPGRIQQRDIKKTTGAKKPKEERITGVRRYRSSDGFEILVGRTDRDNDHLTFRLAKSFDLWFHTADYPGSHVVLRNSQRKSVPPRAITEAAQLAAKFSHAKGSTKVAVNYCQRKFVSKLKGFAPGQVRLSSFKTIMVEPGDNVERIL
ncbi:MAG: NFACT family protein [Acidobacteria bacterium]|nr:NFACT family protein [Acidobacteriota bacterium]